MRLPKPSSLSNKIEAFSIKSYFRSFLPQQMCINASNSYSMYDTAIPSSAREMARETTVVDAERE
jgi:hypothetical protein